LRAAEGRKLQKVNETIRRQTQSSHEQVTLLNNFYPCHQSDRKEVAEQQSLNDSCQTVLNK